MVLHHLGTVARAQLGRRMDPAGGRSSLIHVDVVVRIMAAAEERPEERSGQEDQPSARYPYTYNTHDDISFLLRKCSRLMRMSSGGRGSCRAKSISAQPESAQARH